MSWLAYIALIRWKRHSTRTSSFSDAYDWASTEEKKWIYNGIYFRTLSFHWNYRTNKEAQQANDERTKRAKRTNDTIEWIQEQWRQKKQKPGKNIDRIELTLGTMKSLAYSQMSCANHEATKKNCSVCVCVWQNHCRIQLKWTEFATKITNMAQAKPTDYDNIIIPF